MKMKDQITFPKTSPNVAKAEQEPIMKRAEIIVACINKT